MLLLYNCYMTTTTINNNEQHLNTHNIDDQKKGMLQKRINPSVITRISGQITLIGQKLKAQYENYRPPKFVKNYEVLQQIYQFSSATEKANLFFRTNKQIRHYAEETDWAFTPIGMYNEMVSLGYKGDMDEFKNLVREYCSCEAKDLDMVKAKILKCVLEIDAPPEAIPQNLPNLTMLNTKNDRLFTTRITEILINSPLRKIVSIGLKIKEYPLCQKIEIIKKAADIAIRNKDIVSLRHVCLEICDIIRIQPDKASEFMEIVSKVLSLTNPALNALIVRCNNYTPDPDKQAQKAAVAVLGDFLQARAEERISQEELLNHVQNELKRNPILQTKLFRSNPERTLFEDCLKLYTQK